MPPVRRRVPQPIPSEAAFPIHVNLRVPEAGFGHQLIEMLRWARSELGEGNFAREDAQAAEGEALSFHFRRIEDARAFLEAFPKLELADGADGGGQPPGPIQRSHHDAA